ncbi:TMEM165/GDT1 family protein [Halonotius terrestris]|uniref:TMEM165/GDT1 family protein n=1 Tax=Halonotius terrestris TaxID=2487750 RepID=A0A8J8TDG6_9EURY|nr:TMEM165/GDT1 family protein [Halonotius terrestris]TQQ83056.1 TMEM165/GDT1 family protein [Halonotius terrestris]
MTAFAEIVVIAAIAQLTVLPGEKVQFIIAGLSTRFKPAVVVAAAGAAFAGWTVLEILFGEALQRVLPGVVLDIVTAGLFLVFAVLLVRSAPGGPDPGRGSGTETDGGVVTDRIADINPEFEVGGVTVGGQLGEFLTIFTMMAAGEFGDKTQLVTIGLAAQYGTTAAIWLGEMIVIIPVSLANAYFFHRFSHRFDVRKAHYAGAVLFAFFGLDTVLGILTGPNAVFGHNSLWEAIVTVASEVLLTTV